MATVRELTESYANILINPLRPETEDVCSVCLTFTEGYDTCYRVRARGALHGCSAADLVMEIQLAAVLWRFLLSHEACLARAAGVASFDLVTTVPSGDRQREDAHPLLRIVGHHVGLTAGRHRRLLRRSNTPVSDRQVDIGKFSASEDLSGRSVLLVDDTWTTGANVQSAAGALVRAGAGSVGALVIGRHVQPNYASNAGRLADLPRGFDWDTCALHSCP